MSDQTGTPVSELKMTQRRRMAWLSLASILAIGLGLILCGLFMPSAAERIAKFEAVIITLLGVLTGPIMVYMGGAVATNLKLGK